jgi:hypothetical protein
MSDKLPGLPHRDDAQFDQLTAMEREMAKLFPGFTRFIFAGDDQSTPERIKQQILKVRREIAERSAYCHKNAVCFDCGAKYHGKWPIGDDEDLDDGWEVWGTQQCGHDYPVCPSCAVLRGDSVIITITDGD